VQTVNLHCCADSFEFKVTFMKNKVQRQAAQRSCVSPIHEYVEGQVGWDFGQLDLVADLMVGNPAHGKVVGTNSSPPLSPAEVG